MRYVIAYDITANRRRQKVSDYLAGWGHRIQMSMFECQLGAEDLRRVRTHLTDLLDVGEDRCHIYRLCADCIAAGTHYGQDLEPGWTAVLVV